MKIISKNDCTRAREWREGAALLNMTMVLLLTYVKFWNVPLQTLLTCLMMFPPSEETFCRYCAAGLSGGHASLWRSQSIYSRDWMSKGWGRYSWDLEMWSYTYTRTHQHRQVDKRHHGGAERCREKLHKDVLSIVCVCLRCPALHVRPAIWFACWSWGSETVWWGELQETGRPEHPLA